MTRELGHQSEIEVVQKLGEWIAFLDDDGIWLANKLERQIAEAKQAGADMIACDYATFFPDGRESIEHLRRRPGMTEPLI